MMSQRACPQCQRMEELELHWQQPRFLRCPACGLIWRYPLPNAVSLARLYNDGWKAPDENLRETGATESVLAGRLLELLLMHLRIPNLKGQRVLDFGAGRGAMALELKRRGADVFCIEPFGCEYLSRRGLCAHANLADLPSKLGFDGIVSLEVIEHLLDPRGTLVSLHQRLASGGWLFLTTPNAAGLHATLMGQRWREARKPGHVVFFTPATLRKILVGYGFCDVQRLRGIVRYPEASSVRAITHIVLQGLGLDGGLRIVARKL